MLSVTIIAVFKKISSEPEGRLLYKRKITLKNKNIKSKTG